jgi:hypothetical protein
MPMKKKTEQSAPLALNDNKTNQERRGMKEIQISDQLYAKLAVVAEQMTAESGKKKTPEDAIKGLLHPPILLPPECLLQIEHFMDKNKELGYVTKEEFLKESARLYMDDLKRKNFKTK